MRIDRLTKCGKCRCWKLGPCYCAKGCKAHVGFSIRYLVGAHRHTSTVVAWNTKDTKRPLAKTEHHDEVPRERILWGEE